MSRSFLLTLPLCLVIAACASEPPATRPSETTAAAPAATCVSPPPSTGTSIVRRSTCSTTDQDREAAREQAERLRDEKNRSNPPRLPGTGKP